MVVFPNAKINIGLHVTEKRRDGFHNIETIFLPVPLRDALEIVATPDRPFEFISSGLAVPGDTESNLCVRAWQLLKLHYNLPEVCIHLHKTIPMGAGLGGGSADGAFTITLANKMFNLGLDIDDMEQIARKLGSDCAFFIRNQPAYAFGRGDQFKPVSVDLAGKHIAIVKPNIHISTADAYAALKPAPAKVDLADAINHPLGEWRKMVTNDFEKAINGRFPEIGRIKSKLYELGASFALMTGSGSAVYGIFEEAPQLHDNFRDHFCWMGKL